MYGDPMGNSYATVHANTNDSDILTVLKVWYDQTFTTAQKNALADVIWCNDKSVTSGNGYDFDTTTYYGARGTIANATPTLVCPNAGSDNKLSKFTVSDTLNGNGALNGYKIGLLTADEAAFAGGAYNVANSDYYLYTGATYWLLSPFSFGTGSRLSGVWYVSSTGDLGFSYVINTYGVRPSVSVIGAAIVTNGTGLASDPYIIGV